MRHRSLAALGLITSILAFSSACDQPSQTTKPSTKPTTSATATSLATTEAPSSGPDANIERSKIPDEYKWNLEAVLKDDAAFEALLDKNAKDRKKRK